MHLLRYPNQVLSVALAYDYAKMDELYTTAKELAKKLRHFENKYAHDQKTHEGGGDVPRPMVNTSFSRCCCCKVDAIEYVPDQFDLILPVIPFEFPGQFRPE